MRQESVMIRLFSPPRAGDLPFLFPFLPLLRFRRKKREKIAQVENVKPSFSTFPYFFSVFPKRGRRIPKCLLSWHSARIKRGKEIAAVQDFGGGHLLLLFPDGNQVFSFTTPELKKTMPCDAKTQKEQQQFSLHRT